MAQAPFWVGVVSGSVGVGIQTKFDFKIEVAGVKGTLVESNTTLHFQVAKNFGIGTGLKYYNFTLEDKDFSNRDSRFDYEFFGPVLYGSASFQREPVSRRKINDPPPA